MAEENSDLTVNQKDLIVVTTADLIQHKSELKENNIPIWRINKSGQQVVIPIEKLIDYLGDKETRIRFYIQKNWKDLLYSRKQNGQASSGKNTRTTQDCIENFKLYHNMSFVEREEILDHSIEMLHSLAEKNSTLDWKAVTDVIAVITNMLYINNAMLEENEATSLPQANINGVVVKTKWVIDSLAKLLYNKVVNPQDFKKLSNIKSGSKTIDQINLSFINFMAFCMYYNDFIESGKIAGKVRRDFKSRYYRYYKNRLPELSRLTVETVFDGGMRRLTDEEIKVYSLGALLYDIGKLPDLEYHDSESDFEMKRVKLHVLMGYNMIINAKAFPFEVAAMTVFHHEYYGDKDGYNFTKPIMKKHQKRILSDEDVNFFISYSVDDFLNRSAIATFSCKVLEIVDIFTALTIKKELTELESLTIMKKNFIVERLKIDPILFDIFMGYLVESDVLTEKELLEVNSII